MKTSGNPHGDMGFAVLADDLTGAHSSAARLAMAGYRPVVQWQEVAPPIIADAIAVDMRTRDFGESPMKRAIAWTEYLMWYGVERLELRVDSTLRGHPANELAGVLEVLGKEDVIVMAVPAAPAADRRIVGGRLQLDGVSHAASDAVERIFAEQSSEVVLIGRKELDGGSEGGIDAVERHLARGAGLFLFDGESQQDLTIAARIAEHLETSLDRTLLTVSPGAWLSERTRLGLTAITLIVLSSPTKQNREQIDAMRSGGSCVVWHAQDVLHGSVDLRVPAGTRTVIIETISRSGLSPSHEHGQANVAAVAAAMFLSSIERSDVRCVGMVCGGGQTAASVLDAIGADQLMPLGEIELLCPLSRIASGEYSGLPFATKGGLIGDRHTLGRIAEAVRSESLAVVDAGASSAIAQPSPFAPINTFTRRDIP